MHHFKQSLRISPEIFLPKNINSYPIGDDGMKMSVPLIPESIARLVRITAKCRGSLKQEEVTERQGW